MKKRNLALTISLLALVGLACSANADVISNTFSLGYCYVNSANQNVWNTSETAGANTGITGDFTLSVTPTSGLFSGDGCTFANRVLGNGAPGGGNRSASSGAMNVTVTANYTGALSGGSVKLVIDSISIYAGNYDAVAGGGGGDDEISWVETTAGNTGASAALNLGAASGVNHLGHGPQIYAITYDNLSWNPDDVAVAGETATRTFTLGHSGFTAAYLEGFEIVGHVEYVPEPTTMSLIALGGLALLRRRRK